MSLYPYESFIQGIIDKYHNFLRLRVIYYVQENVQYYESIAAFEGLCGEMGEQNVFITPELFDEIAEVAREMDLQEHSLWTYLPSQIVDRSKMVTILDEQLTLIKSKITVTEYNEISNSLKNFDIIDAYTVLCKLIFTNKIEITFDTYDKLSKLWILLENVDPLTWIHLIDNVSEDEEKRKLIKNKLIEFIENDGNILPAEFLPQINNYLFYNQFYITFDSICFLIYLNDISISIDAFDMLSEISILLNNQVWMLDLVKLVK